MIKLIEVKEFDKIICNADYKYDDRYKYIEPPVFDKLKAFICGYAGSGGNADVLDFMRIGFKREAGDIITIQNYAGLIQVSENCQIQVLPKISLCNNNDDTSNRRTKRIFLNMLCSIGDFPYKTFNDASLSIDKMNLYEIFIRMYLKETRQLVKHGIKSAYTAQENNLGYCKGKLLISQHVQHNIMHKERFYVAYDEFLQDRPENRLVKATLLKLQKQTGSAENSREIRQLLAMFGMVNPSVNYQKDLSESVMDRSMKDYRILLPWSEVFLTNKGFTAFSGGKNSRALLFPMEKLYESYVAQQIKKVFVPMGWDVSIQDRGHYLFNYRNGKTCRQFGLCPDIVLQKDGHVVIMDTKWKHLEDNPRANYGIKQADMYQMYAYSKKYGTPDIWLLYPVNEEMRGKEQIFFNSGDGTYVKLHFVDLDNITDNIKELYNNLCCR
ncbi:MAG TPA: restriction endonuclease [Lachnospiraceae bacterium]|nr:restriction endonuclease [Lachnospiraceae bacterium]